MAEINSTGLDENDFLNLQLFIASKNPRIKKTRLRTRIVWTLVFLLFAKIFYDYYNNVLAIYFLTLSILTAVFFPLYSRWRYKRHYLQHVRENYKNRFGEHGSVEIIDDNIILKTSVSEMKLPVNSLEEIFETAEYYFIKTNSANWIFINKTKEKSVAEVQTLIDSLVNRNGIKYTTDLDWKWK